MIVASRKTVNELRDKLQAYNKILIVGCGTCVTVCQVGGEKEVGVLGSALRMAYKLKGTPKEIHEITIERQCENEFIHDLAERAQGFDAIVSMACGAGVQALAERFPSTPVFPGVNTEFIGILENQGVWAEKCIGCGTCRLGDYGGICPVTRCAKKLLNGPCGGAKDGKCEVDPCLDCGWQLIYNRLKSIGELERLLDLAETTDWSKSNEGGCRIVVREDQRI
jgi:ferredoxin